MEDEMVYFIRNSLLARAMGLTNDLDRAKDLVQDTVLKFLESGTMYNHLPVPEKKAIANVMMKNIYLDQWRRKKARPRVVTDEYPRNYGNCLDKDSKDLLDNIDQRPDMGTKFIVAWAKGYLYRELADEFDLSINSVKSLIRSARLSIREEFKGK